jgi:hypothetical protein
MKSEVSLDGAIQLSSISIGSQIEKRQPIWIVVFKHGNCMAGWHDGREDTQYMSLNHVIKSDNVDIDDYEASYVWIIPSIEMFDGTA